MFFVSDMYTTPPDKFNTPLQKETYKVLQNLHIPFERVDTEVARVSFAPAALMKKMLETKIGAATVFSAILDNNNDVQIVFDKDVVAEKWYGCSDGTTTGYMKIRTNPSAIYEIIKGGNVGTLFVGKHL